MLRRYQRFWVVLVGALLSAPLAISMLAPENDWMLEDELRPRALLPEIPHSLGEWRVLSGKLDAYLRDHFGLRRAMIHMHAAMVHRMLHSGNTMVQIGSDGWLFLRDEETLQQSAGILLRESQVSETAETIASIRSALNKRGVRFVFVSPPNSATIYPDPLPAWARYRGGRTEYDLMLDALATQGIQAVDLRPILRAGRARGPVYYQHDSHWSPLGAVIGFNVVANAAGHPDWQLDPTLVLAPAERNGGDLARMLGIAQNLVEKTQVMTLAAKPLSGSPIVLVIGDSFTQSFPSMLSANGIRATWIHHGRCGLDWKSIEQAHPDEVWWVPTERYLLCKSHPKGMPTPDQSG